MCYKKIKDMSKNLIFKNNKCMLNGVEKPSQIKKKLKDWGLTCEMKI